MLFSSQLGPEGKWCNFRAATTIEKSFTHTAGDVAQLNARTAPTHKACEQTNKQQKINNSPLSYAYLRQTS